jgi:hypothetical protein
LLGAQVPLPKAQPTCVLFVCFNDVLCSFSLCRNIHIMASNTAGSSTITLTGPTPMQAAAIASGGGIWGDPVVELSTIGDQRQATRVKSLEVGEINLRHASKKGNAIVMGCIAFSTGIASFLAGVITIAIPIMAKDLNIPDSLVLWYVPKI